MFLNIVFALELSYEIVLFCNLGLLFKEINQISLRQTNLFHQINIKYSLSYVEVNKEKSLFAINFFSFQNQIVLVHS